MIPPPLAVLLLALPLMGCAWGQQAARDWVLIWSGKTPDSHREVTK
jgi:hypothetical protein